MNLLFLVVAFLPAPFMAWWWWRLRNRPRDEQRRAGRRVMAIATVLSILTFLAARRTGTEIVIFALFWVLMWVVSEAAVAMRRP